MSSVLTLVDGLQGIPQSSIHHNPRRRPQMSLIIGSVIRDPHSMLILFSSNNAMLFVKPFLRSEWREIPNSRLAPDHVNQNRVTLSG